ncbi:hypothetical protein BGX38DRAFT_1197037, partial [Terfezia claveryi]
VWPMCCGENFAVGRLQMVIYLPFLSLCARGWGMSVNIYIYGGSGSVRWSSVTLLFLFFFRVFLFFFSTRSSCVLCG